MDDLEARSIGNRNKLLVEAIMANVEQMMDRKVDAFRQEFQRHSGREPSSARQSKEQELNPKHVLNMKMEAKLTTQPKEVTTSIDSRREKSVDKMTDHGKETSLNNSDKMMTEALTAQMEPIMHKEVDVFRPKQPALGPRAPPNLVSNEIIIIKETGGMEKQKYLGKVTSKRSTSEVKLQSQDDLRRAEGARDTKQNTCFRAVLERPRRTEKKRKNKRFKPPDLDSDLRTNPFQEGEDDVIMEQGKRREPEEAKHGPEDAKNGTEDKLGTEEVLATLAGPITRSRTKTLRHDIGALLHSALAQEDHSDLTCLKTTLVMKHAREG